MKCSIGFSFTFLILLVAITEAQWGDPHMGQGPQGGPPPPPPPQQQQQQPQQPYYPAPNPPPYNTTTTTTTTASPPAIGCSQQGPYQHY